MTATGRLVAVEWSLGPAGARVVCRGAGTPWRGQAGASPDCGYTYQLRSLPERTGGSGRWPVTATGVLAGRLDRVLGGGAGRGSADGAADYADLAAGR